MRKMTEQEIRKMIDACNWATICTVSPEQKPYAIEATPFPLEGDVGFMLNPHGGTRKNIQANKNVLLKYTYTVPDLSAWAGVSCFGQGEFVTDPDVMRRGWESLGEIMNEDLSKAADRFCANPERSPMLLVRVGEMTGQCSAKHDEAMHFPTRATVAEQK